jgi:C4-dicarboxylate transporter
VVKDLGDIILIVGLVFNLLASLLMAYGRIFRSKETIKNESITQGNYNIHEEKHRLKETRIAQLGAIIMIIGFAIQILGHVLFN